MLISYVYCMKNVEEVGDGQTHLSEVSAFPCQAPWNGNKVLLYLPNIPRNLLS